MDWRHVAERLAAGRDVYGELKNLCVWVKDMAGWVRCTAAMSSSLSSRTGATGIATMSSSAGWVATELMSGIIAGPILSPVAVRRATCWRCTQP
jgi:hypothetical protein